MKEGESEAMNYGNEVHKAAEEFVKQGTIIPEKFKYMRPIVETLVKIKGEKKAESKWGVKKVGDRYEPCGFFDRDVWWRGIVDLLIVDGVKGFIVDYKTSKNAKYADVKQLDLLAGAAFVHFPELKTIKSALAFVVSGEFVKKEHTVQNKGQYLEVFSKELDQLEGAHASGVWNANSGPLCGWCPVTACEHNRSRQ